MASRKRLPLGLGLGGIIALTALAARGDHWYAPAAPPPAAARVAVVAPVVARWPVAAALSPVAGAAPTVDGAPASVEVAPPPVDGVRAPGGSPSVRRAARVLVISEDGMRPDLVASMHLPWHERLYRHGAYSWKARTIRTASTLPAHAAMLSGFDVAAHGLTWNNWKPARGYIKTPTIFGAAEQAGMKTAMFVGKFKLRHIATPGTVTVFDRVGYYCGKVADEAAEYMVRERPPLTFVHFSDPDDAGHRDGWASPAYRHSIAHSDNCLGTIIRALDAAGMLDDTLIIVSADHGGHAHMHTGATAVDRDIPWIAHGPGVREDYQIRGAISTVDTAATVLYALGLKTPKEIVGKPVMEIYAAP